MRPYADAVFRSRVLLAIVVAILVALSIRALPSVRLDFSLFSLVEASDEAKAEIDEFYEYLPPRPLDAVAILEWPMPIGRPELDEIHRITIALEGLPSVAGVTSLATAFVIRTPFGIPLPKTLLSIESEEPLLETVGRHVLLDGRLLSRDGKAAALLLVQDETVEDPVAWVDEIRKAIDRLAPEGIVETRFLATGLVEDALGRAMRGDMARSLALEVLCFLVLMPILFGAIHATLVPLAVVACAVLFHLAATVALGLSISLIEVAIPGLITIIALCDAIHMLHRFEEALDGGCSRREAILDMAGEVGTASLYTSLTTAIGFLALLVVDNSAVQDFALSAALGVGIAFSCVITLMPMLLGIAPLGRRRGGMRRFVALDYGRRRLTYAIFFLAAVVSALGAARITIGSRWLEELPPGEAIVQDLTWYQDHFNGFLNLDVKLQGNLDGLAAFRAIESLEQDVLALPGVTGAESYTDWVREWLGNPGGELDAARIVAGLTYLRLSSAAFAFPEHVVTRDFRLGRIRFQIKDVGTGKVLDLIETIEEGTERFPEGLSGEVAGFNRVALESSRHVVVTMLQSLVVSTVSIGLFLMFVYRSLVLGLIATIPNVFPILVGLGLTGLLGIQLRIGIVMIYSLGVGLAVDNTIHLFTRFRSERRAHPDRPVARHLRRSLATTGNALLASSAVLVVGALCYLPSSFRSMRDVGILLSAMVIAALLAELFLVPHLLERFGGPAGTRLDESGTWDLRPGPSRPSSRAEERVEPSEGSSESN